MSGAVAEVGTADFETAKREEVPPRMIQKALEHFEDAIGMIPISEKKDYLNALTNSSTLVREETPKRLILEQQEYNAWASARILVNYWSVRASLFQKYPLKPLTLGSGTLTRAEVDFLKLRRIEVLPDTVSGSPVLHFDCSSALDGSLGECERCLFYITKVLSTHPMAGTGVTAIVSANEATFRSRDKFEHIFRLFNEALPIRFAVVHLVLENGSNSPGRMLSQSFIELFESIVRPRVKIHVSNSKDDSTQSLVQSGLTVQGIPEKLGGLWSSDNFDKWMTSRQSAETTTEVPSAHVTDVLNTLQHRVSRGATLAPKATLKRLDLPHPGRCFSKGVQGLQECLDCIPDNEKAAYNKAVGLGLVESESSRMRFLRAARFDVWKAACQIVAYWKLRNHMFSEDAFSPFSNEKKMSFSPQVVAAMQCKFATSARDDKSGRHVSFIDGTKLCNFDLPTVLKVCFYVFSVGGGSSLARKDSSSVLCWLCDDNPKSLSYIAEIGELLEVLPNTIMALHIFTRSPDRDQGKLAAIVNPQAAKVFGLSYVGKVQYYLGESEASFSKAFETIGIRSCCVPVVFGGSMGIPNGQAQCNEAFSRVPSSLPCKKRSLKDCSPDVTVPKSGQRRASIQSGLLQEDKVLIKKAGSGESQKEFVRKRNALYSRRLYHKRKIEVQVLEDRCSALWSEQETLRKEGGRLTSLLKRAENHIQMSSREDNANRGSVLVPGLLGTSSAPTPPGIMVDANERLFLERPRLRSLQPGIGQLGSVLLDQGRNYALEQLVQGRQQQVGPNLVNPLLFGQNFTQANSESAHMNRQQYGGQGFGNGFQR